MKVNCIFFLWAMLCLNLSFAQEIQLETIPQNTVSSMTQSIYADCPDDITVHASPGANGAYVHWNSINLSTSCSYCTNRIPNCVYMGDYNGHQYYCSLFETDMHSASTYAENFGAYLGSINSSGENSFLFNQLINPSAYIGLNDIRQENLFEWESQETVSFTNWDANAPNDPTGVKDAVALKNDGKWYDCHPNDRKEFVIEFPCIDVELITGLPNGSFFPIGTTQVYYRFTDACGNQTTCHFNVTVVGSGGISLHCPYDIEVECQNGMQGAHVSWPLPYGSTHCQCTNNVPNCIDMGWHNNSQYFCSLFTSSWSDARSWAQSNDTELVSIQSDDENQHLANQLMQNNAYIGLEDPNGNGNFQWIDGTPVTYTNWDFGEPSNLGTNRYVEIKPNGKWKTTPGWNPKEFIVKKNCLQIIQTRGPSNGSFFPLGMTIVEYTATDPCGNRETCTFKVTVSGGVSIECPDDIIVDCEPSWNGNYVYWDAPEAHTCCSQCNTNQHINGFIYMGTQNGSAYYCSTFDASWTDAETYCQSNGGHLVSIESVSESNFLAAQLQIQSAFIGLNDAASEGQLVWSNGSQSTYRNWSMGQSGNNQSNDFTLLTPNGTWTMTDRYAKKEFIMEKNCTHITLVDGKPSGSFFDSGTHRIRYRVTDDCGDVDYCEFYVTVKDCCQGDISIHCPRDYIGCPGDDIDPDDLGEAYLNQADNCLDVEITYRDEYNYISDCVIEIERIWTAQDRNDPYNKDECSQWIDLIDREAPYFVDFPNDITICQGEEIPEAQVWADDDCGIDEIIYRDSLVSGDCTQDGVNYRIFTAIDDCGNETRRIQEIILKADTEAPVFESCPDDIELEAQGDDCSRKVYWSEPDVWDNCSSVILRSNYPSGTTFSEGTHQIIYTATDGCGNESTCTFLITITGENCCEAPKLTCPDDYYGCPGLPIHPIHTGYADVEVDTVNCGAYELGFWDEVINPGSCPGSVMIERLWDAYYFNNPQDKVECFQEIHLEDYEPPVIDNCIDNIYLETDSCCSKQVFWEVPIASDNCGLLSFTSNYQPGDWFPPGSTEVKYIATDLCGNVTECYLNVFIDCHRFTDYCESGALSSDNSWIQSIKIEDQGIITGNNCGYALYDEYHIPFEATAYRSLELSAQSTNSNEKGYWRVWIDFNQDGDFEDQLEKVLDPGQVFSSTINTNIYVPSFAVNGKTIMRVSYQSMAEYNSSSVQECCDLFAEGEVEDYVIDIQSMTTNIDEEEEEEAIFSLYPNPAVDQLRFELNYEKNTTCNVLIKNILGNTVYKNTVNYYDNSKDIIDIYNVEGGIYFFELQIEDRVYRKQFVISR